jgi:hypothetical protein
MAPVSAITIFFPIVEFQIWAGRDDRESTDIISRSSLNRQ